MRVKTVLQLAGWLGLLGATAGNGQTKLIRDPRASFVDVDARRAALKTATDPRLLDAIGRLGSCVGAAAAAPPAEGHIIVPRHYLVGNHGPVNPAERSAVYLYARLERTVTDGANQFLVTTSHVEAQCALDTLDRWAKAGAMLDYDPKEGSQAWYQVGWTLGSVSLAYSILQHDEALDAAEKSRVVAWMDKSARRLIGFDPPDAPNVNLHFWRAMAATSVGILASDDVLYRFGVDTYRSAIGELDERGALPKEMLRRERAIHYQTFALEPLVMIAELAERQGLDLYGYSAHGHTLRDAVVFFGRAVDDPAILKAYTRDTQDFYSDALDNFSWVELYVQRFGSAGLPQSLLTGIGMQTDTTRLGGSTTVLAGRTLSVAAEK